MAECEPTIIIAPELWLSVSREGQVRWLQDFEQVWALAWLIVLLTGVPLGVGVWLDQHWGTTPLFALIGVVVGVVLTIAGMKRRLRS